MICKNCSSWFTKINGKLDQFTARDCLHHSLYAAEFNIKNTTIYDSRPPPAITFCLASRGSPQRTSVQPWWPKSSHFRKWHPQTGPSSRLWGDTEGRLSCRGRSRWSAGRGPIQRSPLRRAPVRIGCHGNCLIIVVGLQNKHYFS